MIATAIISIIAGLLAILAVLAVLAGVLFLIAYMLGIILVEGAARGLGALVDRAFSNPGAVFLVAIGVIAIGGSLIWYGIEVLLKEASAQLGLQ